MYSVHPILRTVHTYQVKTENLILYNKNSQEFARPRQSHL